MNMNKNCKSRIPVPVTKQKSSKLSCDEENLKTRNNFLKKQTSDANNVTKIHLMQKKTEKKIGSQSAKLRNLKDNNKNPDIKNKSASLKTSIKYNIVGINNNTSDKSVKSNDKNKSITTKANMSPNLTNNGVRRVFNVNMNHNKKSILPSIDAKIKSNSAEEKKENLPSPVYYSFEEEVCTPVGNLIASKQDYVSENENVEFEANEIYRKMILSNKELSPSVRKLMPNLRLSSLQSERPSVYQKFQIPNDPLKEALKALENTCLSATRIKKENNLAQSPRRETFRDSIYTPRGDPNEEFLKKLEDFKLKQLQRTAPRSTKKVTFNLKTQEYTPKNTCDIQHNLVKNSEQKLMQINEKSEENTPNSPHSVINSEFKTSVISSKHEQSNIANPTIMLIVKDSPNKVGFKNNTYLECNETKATDQSDITLKNDKKTEPIIFDKSVYHNRETSPQVLKENSSPVFICDSKHFEKYTNSVKDSNVQLSTQKRIKQSAKVYTPKPISLSSKSKICPDSYSPELLVDRKSVIMTDLAPICTPLVLKSQAKTILFSPEIDDGPIPLKLDFTEEEKDLPKKQTYRNHTLFTLDNIVTVQKQLDDLADQECHLSLINENFPVICGRYLTNPVARTLNEGDDMHFIPIRF